MQIEDELLKPYSLRISKEGIHVMDGKQPLGKPMFNLQEACLTVLQRKLADDTKIVSIAEFVKIQEARAEELKRIFNPPISSIKPHLESDESKK